MIQKFKLLCIGRKRQSKGLSILEILIAIAIVSFVCVPTIQILYSIQPQHILKIISRVTDGIIRNTFHERGDLEVSYHKGGLWNSSSLTNVNFYRHSCIDFDPVYKDTNTISPLLFVYTREELGISTSTVLTGTALLGQRLYISANSSSTTEPDVFVYDVSTYGASPYGQNANISNASKPSLAFIQSKNFGPGVSSIQSRGTHIISANTGVKNQVDVSGTNLVTQNPFTIPGSNSSTSPLTKVVLYASSTLIVGTEKSVLAEIAVFNIDTGQVVHTIETGYGVNDIVIANNRLIVAGPRDPEIEVFSLDEQNFGQKIGQYDLPGGSGNAKALAMFGDALYVGRTKGGNEFVLLDMEPAVSEGSTSTAQTFIHFKEILNKKINWSIDSILNFDRYALLFTADEYKEFQLYEFGDSDLLSDDQTFNLKTVLDLPARVNSSMCFRNTVWITFQTGSDIPLALIVF